MKSIKFLAVVLIFTAVPAFAQSSKSADLAVTAEVIANCTIATTPVDFLTYDPLSATADDDGVGTITVACTRGIPTLSVEINNGASGVRQMTFGAEVLGYQLYSNAARTSVWGTGAAGVNPNTITAGTVNPAGKTLNVYGRIPAGQDAAVGNYSQTLQATINY